MSMPPRGFGGRGEHAVVVERRAGAFTARVDGRPLAGTFATERAARLAVAAQVLRLDATGLALLGRIRRGLVRKLR
jgi:hypothetical protein